MSTSEATENALRAAEKLRRQQERIEREELALTNNGVPLFEKPKQPSQRVKGNRPFDFSDQTSQASEDHVVRVNKYSAAISRDTSLSRSLSSVSQHTINTSSHHPFDLQRSDSSMNDNAGFQTYMRGGARPKGPNEQIAYGDKVEKQKTVEGEVDRDEVLAVFKQPLPTPDFIKASPGFTDGIVQFVQHPNGDVAAHMWSQRSYQWENIGQFSNIRKKIEGQLAGERLKGETAYQKLQQNSLAYFRVVAKQREATAMGTAFGQDNIKAALPEPQKQESMGEQQRSSTIQAASLGEEHNRMLRQKIDDTWRELGQNSTAYPQKTQSTGSPLQRPQRTTGQGLSPSANPFTSYQAASAKGDDPFSSNTHNESSFSAFNWQTGFNTFGAAVPMQSAGVKGLPTLPALGLPTMPTQTARQSLYGSTEAGIAKPNVTTAKQHSFLFPPKPRHDSLGVPVSPSPSTPTSRNKPTTPLSSREALRDQLHRTVDTAVKRSLSQANIAASLARAVAQEPTTQQQAPSGESEREEEMGRDDSSPEEYSDDAPTSYFQLGLPKQITRAEYEELCTDWYDYPPEDQPTPRPLARRILTEDSSPDKNRPTEIEDRLSPIKQPQVMEPFYASGQASRKDYDKELRDWFTNGSTFARQEELYKHIMATAPKATPVQMGMPTAVNRTVARPFGTTLTGKTPIKRQTSTITTGPSDYDEGGLTRVLIPVYENLASYVQGPEHQRRDYWAPWVQPPEWCIDRSPNGNNSFFDNTTTRPPARVGRDPRYKKLPGEGLQFGGLSPQASRTVGTPMGTFGAGGLASPRGLAGRYAGGAYAYGRY